jgi:hypothetical protein
MMNKKLTPQPQHTYNRNPTGTHITCQLYYSWVCQMTKSLPSGTRPNTSGLHLNTHEVAIDFLNRSACVLLLLKTIVCLNKSRLMFGCQCFDGTPVRLICTLEILVTHFPTDILQP